MLSPAQCRAARALLGWDQAELAKKAGVAPNTVLDFETEARDTQEASKAKIGAALERGGIEFTARDGVKRRRRL